MRVVVHGFYGAGNVGDEAILSVLLQTLERADSIKPIVFSRRPSAVRRLHATVSHDPDRMGGVSGRFQIRRADAYILGGGGLLKDYGESPHDLLAWLRWLRVAQAAGRPTVLWAVGVENLRFEESIRCLRETVGRVDLITVRDEASRDRLQRIGVVKPVHVMADPAVQLGFVRSRTRVWHDPPRIVVCMRHWFKHGLSIPDQVTNERMLMAVAAALDVAVDDWNASIEFLPFRTASHDDDRSVLKAVRSRMRNRASVVLHGRAPTPTEAADCLARADLVVAMRLHALILAASAGVPCIGLAYMEKVRDFMSSIEQERYCMEIEAISEATLVGLMLNLQSRYDVVTDSLRTATIRLHDRLETGCTQLLRALVGRTETT